jgi:hypothetical protein
LDVEKLYAARARYIGTYRNLFRSPDEWQEVHDGKHKYPHTVNEVPVHFTGLDCPVLLRGKVAAQGTQQQDN